MTDETTIRQGSTAGLGKVYQDYHQAYEAARQCAIALQRPIGLEGAREFGRQVYRVKGIPADPAKRYGWELRCEVVDPTAPRCETPGGRS